MWFFLYRGKTIPREKKKSNPTSQFDDFSGQQRWWTQPAKQSLTVVVNGCKSQRQAAKDFGVPQSTLQKLIKGKTETGVKPGSKPLLIQLESKLVDYAVDRSTKGTGFGKKQFFEYATQLAEWVSEWAVS